MEIKSTLANQSTTCNFLAYGAAGSGKTTLIKTLPNPVILSAERGLMSLSDCDLPYIEINTFEDLIKAYQMLCQDTQFDSVAIDSISEVAEIVLAHELAIPGENGKKRNGMQVYGAMADRMIAIIKKFRDLPKHVYMTAKLEKEQDEMNRMLYSPRFPGKQSSKEIPHIFDYVMALRVEQSSDGTPYRVLQCQNDGLWVAKSRTTENVNLNMFEPTDLGAIINKIKGVA